MNRVYKKKQYNIYDMGDGYIIHNIDKPFNEGHTHINNYKTAVYIIDLAIHKSIPHHICEYFMISLKRLSTDDDYIRKIDDILESKQNRHHKPYYNKPKHFKKKK